MSVFEAFPGAVVSGIWQIGKSERGTLVGEGFTRIGDLDVIVDEADTTSINYAPNEQPIDADLLVYAKPSQLPTVNTRALIAGYLLYDGENDDYFAIVDARIGRNQETGTVEHIELYLKQTEVVNES